MELNIEDLKDIIEQTYGFKRELIQSAEQDNLNSVTFQVNGILYFGWTAHAGAVPELKVTGNAAPYHDNRGTPVTERYYNECIKGHKARIIRFIDGECGDWEDTGIRFDSQEAAEEYLRGLVDPRDYCYDFLD